MEPLFLIIGKNVVPNVQTYFKHHDDTAKNINVMNFII